MLRVTRRAPDTEQTRAVHHSGWQRSPWYVPFTEGDHDGLKQRVPPNMDIDPTFTAFRTLNWSATGKMMLSCRFNLELRLQT